MNPPFSPRSLPKEVIPSQRNAAYSFPRNERFGKRKLPSGFIPDNTSIICGRGKTCTESPGNKRLRAIVKRYIGQYLQARSKAEKTTTVNIIFEAIQGADKNQGLFIRQHEDSWWEVEETVARETVGCLIRDCLHTQYRSSSKAKFLKKRREQQEISKSNKEQELAGEETGTLFTSHSSARRDYITGCPRSSPTSSYLYEGTNAAVMPSFLPNLFLLTKIPDTPLTTNTIPFHPPNAPLSNLGDLSTYPIAGRIDSSLIGQDGARMTQMLQELIFQPGGKDGTKKASHEPCMDNQAPSLERKRPLADGDTPITFKGPNNSSFRFPDFGNVNNTSSKGGNLEISAQDDSCNSSDSDSWKVIVPSSSRGGGGRGRGYLQLARDVVGNDCNFDNLPDDLSGIFDEEE